MKKFAFLIHLRSSYRKDFKVMANPFGWIPEPVYRLAFKNRPLPPFIWSEVTLTPGATEAEGYIIMLPYTAKQLLQQQKLMLPRINQALELAASKGAHILGLGALTSPVTKGGTLVADNPHLAVTNGNAFTSVITWKKTAELINASPVSKPVVALVGATGSVGTLLSLMLAKHNDNAQYIVIARNQTRLDALAEQMLAENSNIDVSSSQNMDDVKQADIVVLLTSAADSVLESRHLKDGAIVLDDTQPRNTHPRLAQQRPDVTIIDGGLVSVPHLNVKRNGIALPQGISFACLAETMLLAQAGHQGNFSIGNPTLQQAEFISELADKFSYLGFYTAPDHSFGKLVQSTDAAAVLQQKEINSLQVA